MSHYRVDARLRTLSSWLPGLDELLPIASRITEVRAELRQLQASAAEVRAQLISSCPVELTDLEMRFWPKVHIVDDDHSCWEWKTGRRSQPDNYGSFRWVNPVSGKSEVSAASRVAVFLASGELPDHGCHTCDNPPCCRPAHLYSGTHADNMRDRQARGRYVTHRRLLDQQGVRNTSALLTDELVISARDLAREGLMLSETHSRIKSPVSPTVLRFAITGRTWNHLDAICPPVVKPRNGSAIKGKKVAHRPPSDRRFSDDQIREIRAARKAKIPLRVLAEQHGVSIGMISSIEHRRSYAHIS